MTSAKKYPAGVTADSASLTLAFNGKITLLTLLLLPVLVGLGLWQLERADEKRQLEAAFSEQQRQAPESLNGLGAAAIDQLANYTRVSVEGRFEAAHTWLLDNKMRSGRFGYEVVTPFLLSNGQRILVNRGWLQGGARRDQLPLIASVEGNVTLFASVYRPTDNSFLEARAEADSWPRVIPELDTDSAAKTLKQPLLEPQLRLDEFSPGAFTTQWTYINSSPAKHTGYAVQWFAMALALFVCFVFANTNLMDVLKRRRENPTGMSE